jgi:anti-anti-sigma factor
MRFSQQPWRGSGSGRLRADKRKDATMPASGSPITVTSDYPNHTTALVVVAGEIDISTAPLVADELAIALRPPPPELLFLDLSQVAFMGSEGVRLLIEAHERARLVKSHLRVVASHRAVRRPLEVTGIATMLEIHDSLPPEYYSTRGNSSPTSHQAAPNSRDNSDLKS